MEIAIAWLTMAALILLILGIIDPGIALFWSKGVKTRKRAAMIYGFVFFATAALSIIFFPRTNLESKLYTLLVLHCFDTLLSLDLGHCRMNTVC